MKLYRKLYIGGHLSKKQHRVIRQLKTKGTSKGVYLICLPSNPQNLLDIIPSWCSGHYEDLFVVGIALGKKEAFEVTAEIVQEVYENTGGFAIADYVL